MVIVSNIPENRGVIENQIIAKANKLWREPSCLDEASVANFLASWSDLLKYYKDNNDANIGVEVMREFVRLSEIFQSIMNDDGLKDDCRKIADDTYADMKYLFIEIVKNVETWLYPTGR